MEAAITEARRAAPPPRLKERYESEVVEHLTRRFGYRNPMEVPRLRKITLNSVLPIPGVPMTISHECGHRRARAQADGWQMNPDVHPRFA